MKPVLYIFSGLPGTGKSTLAQRLASELQAAYIRIDTIEQALHELCQVEVESEGYRTAYRLTADNLQLGLTVVADSCNPIVLTRREWEAVAQVEHAEFVNIEISCSNEAEHRRRVETRRAENSGSTFPTWEQVVTREYHPWQEQRLELDTSGQTVHESFAQLRELVFQYLRNNTR